MKRTCGIYVRCATVDQDGHNSLAVQEAAGIALCQRNGWKFQVFREVGTPGTILKKMVDLVKAGKINRVFVNTWDRLSRNTQQLIAIKKQIEQSRAKIVTAAQRRRIAPATDTFMAEVTAALRRHYYSSMAERRWALAKQKKHL